MILYTMLYGQLPFNEENKALLFQKIIAGDFTFRDDIVKISDAAKDLIRGLLDTNPVTRLSMA